MKYIDGIDVSHHQGDINWDLVKQSGKKFAFMKATEGIDFVDNKFKENWSEAKIHRGAYHFFRPAQNAEKQANLFLNTTDAGELPPALDLEVDDNQTNATIIAGVKKWLEIVEKDMQIKPLIYSSQGFMDEYFTINGKPPAWALEYPLWIANYTTESEPAMPTGWDKWAVWQYSKKGRVPGILGDVDLDYGIINWEDDEMIKLEWPVNGPITQYFGVNPQWYSQYGYAGHNGIDIGIPNGTPIKASADGTVTRVAYDPPGYGNYVILTHNGGEFITYYAHLKSSVVNVNQTVKVGDVIGLSNNTGNSTGPHLHWELRIPGKINPGYKNCFDPLKYLDGETQPVPPEETQGGFTIPSSGIELKVLADALKIRSGPGITYPQIGMLYANNKITSTEFFTDKELWVKTEKGWSAVSYNGNVFLEVVE